METNKNTSREHPILFSAPMVRALLAGRKHVTRRLSPQWMKVKAGDQLWVRETWRTWSFHDGQPVSVEFQADGGRMEDLSGSLPASKLAGYEDWYERIAVSSTNECIAAFSRGHEGLCHDGEEYHWSNGHSPLKWRPSIHMPRWASRILLEVEEDTRQERLLDITEEEAFAEGAADTFSREKCPGFIDDMRYTATFSSLWNSLHTKPGERWEDNPVIYRIGKFHEVGRYPFAC